MVCVALLCFVFVLVILLLFVPCFCLIRTLDQVVCVVCVFFMFVCFVLLIFCCCIVVLCFVRCRVVDRVLHFCLYLQCKSCIVFVRVVCFLLFCLLCAVDIVFLGLCFVFSIGCFVLLVLFCCFVF